MSNPLEPRAEYTRRLAERQAREDRCLRRLARLQRLRATAIGLVVVLALLAEKEKPLAKLAMIGVPALVIDRVTARQRRLRLQLQAAGRATAFYEERLAALAGDWAGRGDPGDRYRDDEHPYAADLDLFGVGGLFERLSLARLRLGGDTLARWLLTPAEPEAVLARQEAVEELRNRLDLREHLVLLGDDASGGFDLGRSTEWGETEDIEVPSTVRLLLTLTSLTLAVGLVSWLAGFGPAVLVGALLIGGGLPLWLGRRLRPVMRTAEGEVAGLSFLAAVLARLESEPAASPKLDCLRQLLTLGGAGSRKVARLARLLRWLAWSPPGFFVFAGTHLACAVTAWHRKHRFSLTSWLDLADEYATLAALAAYAFENPDDPFPEFVAAGPSFEAEALAHPLLPREQGVPNDISLNDAVRVLVVSGSNMSGKSTFLRTVGVNAVLALAGAPVRAKRLRLSPLTVGATLRVLDSLRAGRSRFAAELARLRRLLDLAGGPVPLLFLLDELFAGTNAHDRRLGAEAIVRRLLDAGAVGLVTTHDLAQTDLPDCLGPRVVNVHFADQFADGVMTFDYRMRPGVVEQTNALALMRAIGLDV